MRVAGLPAGQGHRNQSDSSTKPCIAMYGIEHKSRCSATITCGRPWRCRRNAPFPAGNRLIRNMILSYRVAKRRPATGKRRGCAAPSGFAPRLCAPVSEAKPHPARIGAPYRDERGAPCLIVSVHRHRRRLRLWQPDCRSRAASAASCGGGQEHRRAADAGLLFVSAQTLKRAKPILHALTHVALLYFVVRQPGLLLA